MEAVTKETVCGMFASALSRASARQGGRLEAEAPQGRRAQVSAGDGV